MSRLASLGLVSLLAGCADDPPGSTPPDIDDDTPSFALRPPWRSSSLPADTHVSTAGHGGDGYFPCPGSHGGGCGYDLGASRWDPAARAYSGDKTNGGSSQADHAIWGMDLHAPVDGEVVACWRNMPDDLPDREDDTPPGCAALASGECMATGNHLWIRSADGHLILLAHLMQNSIPERLCPIAEDLPIPDSNADAPCAIAGKQSGPTDASRLERLEPAIAYPRITQGEFVGRVGESGQAGGPHLHLSVGTYEMDADDHYCRSNVLIRWIDAEYQVRSDGRAPDAGTWTPLDAEPLPIDLKTFFLIQPDN
ncbi:MAG: hypothetical protein IPO88_03430 [Nannocystis sp.]|uniref:hypothetical protein n=1 Tax=Nannocystis sp. TaxID=1962667 RepID=UPI0024277637|nr:hypothetical protein [Nannocystis sp.]MBK9752554.1 hypothetical protein [Nannocystis sp.]